MRRAGIGVEIGDVVVGLVAVGILADQPGDVGRRVVGQGRGRVEQVVELLLERRVAAEQLDLAVDVVLVEERGLPAVRLGIVAPPRLGHVADLDRIVRRPPGPVGEPGPREADRGIEHVAIVEAALAQRLGIVVRAGRFGEDDHGPVVVGIFLRTADRFPHLVGRNVVEVVVVSAAERARAVLELAVEGALADVGPGGGIVRLDALNFRFRERDHRVPADHRAGLDALERPDRRTVRALLGLPDQVTGEHCRALRLHQRQ